MLCPNCKKQETSYDIIKQDKKTNVVLRNRYCSKCDFSFSTSEKIKIIKKRKPRPDKLFMNYRFYLYGAFRILALIDARDSLDKSLGGIDAIIKKFDEFGFVSQAGKSGVYYADKKIKGSEKVVDSMAEGKKKTIQTILSGVYYWKYKNHLMKNDKISEDEIEIITSRLAELGLKQWKKSSKSDEENKLCNKVLDELENFHKSIATYIKKKEKEYNQDFFINYRIENKFHPWNSKELKFFSKYWKKERNWELYLYSR